MDDIIQIICIRDQPGFHCLSISSKKKYYFIIIACILLLLFPALMTGQAHAGSAKDGKRIFQRCVACHHANREGNKIGPSLKDVMQRQAGIKPGYRFSPGMVRAGETGLVWNKQTLTDFLHNPQAIIRGTRMPSVKITTEQEMDDLITYLEEASQD